MSNRSIALTDAIYDYLLANSLREPAVMRRLRQETAKVPGAMMQIAPEQGQFMALLVRLMVPGAVSRWAPSPATAPWPSPCRRTAASSPAT